jgi:putative ABC transport system permease protein
MKIAWIAAEAADSLASNMRRGLLAALGLMVGVASVVCVISAGKGLESLIVKEMGSFGRPTHLEVQTNWRYLSSIGWTKRSEPITDEDREAIMALSSLVARSTPVRDFQFKTRYGSRGGVTRILAVSSDYFPMEKLSLARGRTFNVEDDRTQRQAAIIGAALAEKLFGAPGSAGYEDPIGKRIAIGTFGEIEVVGILNREPPSLLQSFSNYDTTNNGTLFVPYSCIRRFGSENETYQLKVEAVSAERAGKAKDAILSVLAQKHGLWDGQPKYAIESGQDSLKEVTSMTDLVTNFVSAVAGISLIVAGIGVMNVMLISVKERTREIGTRKALGARGSWIGNQFLIESLVVCLSGGIAGVLLATVIAFVVGHATSLPAIVPPGTVPLSIILSTLVAVTFGWLPARRASKLDPCEALRYE